METQVQRYDQYLRQVIHEPYIIGYQRCQYRSVYDPYRGLLKQGLLDLEGKLYKKVVKVIADTNRIVLKELYD